MATCSSWFDARKVREKRKSESDGVKYEFGGPRGVLQNMVMMPITLYLLTVGCSKKSCSLLQPPSLPSLKDFFDTKASVIYICWICFQVLLFYLPVGKILEGQPLASGYTLKYRCNGFVSFLLSVSVFLLLLYSGCNVTYVYDKLVPLVATAAAVSVLLSLFVFVKAPSSDPSALALGGNTGNLVYDFYMGRELNPRVYGLDLKFFCELRPGLIGWVILDLIFLVQSWKSYGEISPILAMVVAFHALYVADALYFEETVLTTLDITREGFGFMLAFGDLTWVPFVFSLHARFLLEHPQTWDPLAIIIFLLLNSVGYWIFRSANNEKDQFRHRERGSKTRVNSVLTACGKDLLASGWWGLCRHPNYLGDLIMALAWCLPCGFQHLLPWFYLLYLTATLFHRAGRDHAFCQEKYGPSWTEYCRRVPYKIIPGIF